MRTICLSAFLLSALRTASAESLCQADCSSGECIFNVNVDLEKGQLGYFVFDECPGLVSPTLGIEIGVTYKFSQAGVFNYFHPMGFAYFPDGDHAGLAELEPGVVPPGTSSTCNETLTCPAPMYFLGDQYLGTYSNDPDVLANTTGEGDFGLEEYEPRFFYPFVEWLELGPFSVHLRFTNDVYPQDIFYFCHIHQFMTGRIKLLRNGTAIHSDNIPVIPYEYDKPSSYDQSCGGTMGLEDFQLPNAECPDRFVCGIPEDNSTISTFSACIETMNCRMIADMTTGVTAQSEIALFLHQMIPHHENAINMAKALIASGDLDECTDYTSEDPKCLMFDIAISIVNGQNLQVQQMRTLLENWGYPATDDCKVDIASDS